MEAIENNGQESGKEWLLWVFKRTGTKNTTTAKRQFWQQYNQPIELWSGKVIKKRIDYIHNNPIESAFTLIFYLQ